MMNEIFDETGRVFPLGCQFASGGQGVIYRLKETETLCVKAYHEKPDLRQRQKLKLLRSHADALANVAALPKSMAFADAALAEPIGIIIPFVRGHEIHELYGTRARLHHFPKANFKFQVHAAYNLALVFDELHKNGIIIGDISEQNIKVLPDATVRLIDCDSFQVSEGEVVYTSDVGTPLWTPPELQGRDLTGLSRTRNHDLFGLAQLIFLLCFAGRHPFAGVPRGSRQLSPEAAIGEFAFVFAPEHLGLPLAPPPGCPPFSALPPELRQLFSRAFLPGAELPGGRPTAAEWKDGLEKFLKNLTVCELHPTHVFWKQAPACPWCTVIREAEVDLFPHRSEPGSDTGFFYSQDGAYVTQLRNLRPHPFKIQAPPAFAELAPEPLPHPPGGVWNSLQKTVDLGNWKKNWLSAPVETNRQALADAEALLKSSLATQHALVAEYNQEFIKLRSSMLPVLRLLSKPANIQREIETALGNERRQYQLQEFMGDLLLREAVIPGVGLGDKAVLQSHGIESAGDISAAALGKIQGFGENQKTQLLAWHNTCQGSFKYDLARPISGLLRVEIERQTQERMATLKAEATEFKTKFGELQTICNARLRMAQVQAEQASRQRDQARANLAFLEEELREN
jgi:DNA-binding helix-hairpin-helix protein with protein kinase domain